MLRLRNNNKKAELSLGLNWTPADLEDAQKEKPKPSNAEKRRILTMYQAKIEEVKHILIEESRIDEDVEVIKDMVRVRLLGKKADAIEVEEASAQDTFINFFLTVGAAKAKSTAASFDYTLSTMRKYDVQLSEKDFEGITYAWLSDFEAWMKEHSLSQNTRKIHFGNIRIAMREAYKRELTNNDPFRRFTFRPEKTRKRSVEVDTLRGLFDYPVEPFAEIYRDMFKLIFMLCGINTIDLYNLTAITPEGRIDYKRAKTGRLYSIKVEPEALEIINRYRGEKKLLCLADRWGDYKNFQHQMNNAIRRFGIAQGKGKKDKDADTPAPFAQVTSYWARHSWASIARSIGVSKDDISLALGHGDGNPVTSVYIKEDLGAVDRANRRVLDWVLYGGENQTV